jgi:hypothetical protein
MTINDLILPPPSSSRKIARSSAGHAVGGHVVFSRL